jgi:hypothetical protein
LVRGHDCPMVRWEGEWRSSAETLDIIGVPDDDSVVADQDLLDQQSDPFGGYGDDMRVVAGATEPPTVPGIGFELKRSLRDTFEALLGDEPSVRL